MGLTTVSSCLRGAWAPLSKKAPIPSEPSRFGKGRIIHALGNHRSYVRIGCAVLAFILAVSTGNAEVVQTLINSLLDTFKLGAGAIIALVGENAGRR
jgi:hypothetical protein